MAIYIEGQSVVGHELVLNEDHLIAETLSENKDFLDDYVLCVIDGNGTSYSPEQDLDMVIQASKIASSAILRVLRHAYRRDKKLFISNPRPFLETAFIAADSAIASSAFIREDVYGAFMAAATLAFIHGQDISIVHTGNTRAYVLTESTKSGWRLLQLTKDHTLAQELVDIGELKDKEYYSVPERYTLMSGIGVFSKLKIDFMSYTLKEGEVFLLTSDGVHYCLNETDIINAILNAKTIQETVSYLVEEPARKELRDNASAIIAINVSEEALKEVREANAKEISNGEKAGESDE